MSPIIFAILAALSFGLWTVFHKLASPYINQVLGAILVSFVAVIIGSLWFIPQAKHVQLFTNPKGVIFLICAGVLAFFIDFFTLQAYSKGLTVTIGGPIIIGGSVAIATVIGFFMGDAVTVMKIFGLLASYCGSVNTGSV